MLRDVIDGKVSHDRARHIYGVVIDLNQRQVDEQATRRARETMVVSE